MTNFLFAKVGTFNQDAKLFESGAFNKDVPAKSTRSSNASLVCTSGVGWKPELLCTTCVDKTGCRKTWREYVSRVDFDKMGTDIRMRFGAFDFPRKKAKVAAKDAAKSDERGEHPVVGGGMRVLIAIMYIRIEVTHFMNTNRGLVGGVCGLWPVLGLTTPPGTPT
jgi:hypothetical protein